MARLLLVRHAAVELDLDRPAATWELTTEGRAASRELATALAPVPRVLASTELKARATAAPIAEASGVEVEVDPRLREVERPVACDLADHRDTVRRYLAGEELDGWEPRADALARFRAAVEGADGAVVVTHGTVLALFCGFDFERWKRLQMPEVVEWES